MKPESKSSPRPRRSSPTSSARADSRFTGGGERQSTRPAREGGYEGSRTRSDRPARSGEGYAKRPSSAGSSPYSAARARPAREGGYEGSRTRSDRPARGGEGYAKRPSSAGSSPSGANSAARARPAREGGYEGSRTRSDRPARSGEGYAKRPSSAGSSPSGAYSAARARPAREGGYEGSRTRSDRPARSGEGYAKRPSHAGSSPSGAYSAARARPARNNGAEGEANSRPQFSRNPRAERPDRFQRDDRPARAGRGGGYRRDERNEGSPRSRPDNRPRYDRSDGSAPSRYSARPHGDTRFARPNRTEGGARPAWRQDGREGRFNGERTERPSVRRESSPRVGGRSEEYSERQRTGYGGRNDRTERTDRFSAPRRPRGEAGSRPMRSGGDNRPMRAKRPDGAPDSQANRQSRHEGRSSPEKDGRGERIQKALADLGWGARREIEGWIERGEVWVNGQVAQLGDSINVGDRVDIIRGQKSSAPKFSSRIPRHERGSKRGSKEVERSIKWSGKSTSKLSQVLIYHKPEGEIVSKDDPQGRASAFDRLPRLRRGRWVNIGRLDLASSGLLLFTDNGELANALMHPSSAIEREYAVRINGQLSEEHIRQLIEGIELEEGLAQCVSVSAMSANESEGRNHWYKFVLTEGRNREIRRMVEALGFQVSRLMRTRYGDITLPRGLWRGHHELLESNEVARLMRRVGVA